MRSGVRFMLSREFVVYLGISSCLEYLKGNQDNMKET